MLFTSHYHHTTTKATQNLHQHFSRLHRVASVRAAVVSQKHRGHGAEEPAAFRTHAGTRRSSLKYPRYRAGSQGETTFTLAWTVPMVSTRSWKASSVGFSSSSRRRNGKYHPIVSLVHTPLQGRRHDSRKVRWCVRVLPPRYVNFFLRPVMYWLIFINSYIVMFSVGKKNSNVKCPRPELLMTKSVS